MSHTNGPWNIREGITHITVFGADNEILFHEDKRIPRVIDDSRLIAAAPDLLEALLRAERKLSAYTGVCSGDKELTNTVLPMVRTAIAKARVEE